MAECVKTSYLQALEKNLRIGRAFSSFSQGQSFSLYA